MTEQEIARAVESGMTPYVILLSLWLLLELAHWLGFRRRRL